jgi:hypothetical protein
MTDERTNLSGGIETSLRGYSKSDLRSFLEDIVVQKWFVLTLVQEWPETKEWPFSDWCKNDVGRNNEPGSHQCKNDLRDVAWWTPLECWCTSRTTYVMWRDEHLWNVGVLQERPTWCGVMNTFGMLVYFKNNLRDVAWWTPLECWCTSRSTPLQSCCRSILTQIYVSINFNKTPIQNLIKTRLAVLEFLHGYKQTLWS